MENKINLEEIIEDELYNRHLYFNKINNIQIKNICLEFGQQLLELASENATYDWNDHEDIIIDKQSILDTIKQVE